MPRQLLDLLFVLPAVLATTSLGVTVIAAVGLFTGLLPRHALGPLVLLGPVTLLVTALVLHLATLALAIHHLSMAPAADRYRWTMCLVQSLGVLTAVVWFGYARRRSYHR